MSLVDVQDLRVDFGSARTAVHEVSLSVAPGECVALVGEPGSGKSVTARSLLGLAGTRAKVSASRLRIAGTDATGFGERQWRSVRGREVGLVSQDALVSLDPLRTIGVEIAESVRRGGLRGAAVRQRVLKLLAEVGMPDPEHHLDAYPHQLSGGLRQRALIASALAGRPKLLIADEPTTALDAVVQAQVLRLLAEIPREDRGLLLVSHDLAVVSELADRVLVLHEGRVVDSGTPAQLFAAAQHPRTRDLVRAAEVLPWKKEHVDGDTAVLRAEGLTKSYPSAGGRRAVEDVSLSVAPGEVLGVVGQSGAGKSTLARILLALEWPDSGEVLLDGKKWSDLAERARRPRRGEVQMVHQDALSAFDPRWTVQRVLDEAVPRGSRAERALRISELLEQVELDPDIRGRRPHQLSGGQRQRVAIARALATKPRVLVCDEPVSALDASVRGRVLSLLQRVRARTGVGLVFITHDLSVARGISDRVAVMHEGRFVEQGPTEEIFTTPKNEYTRTLLAAMPSMSQRSTQSKPHLQHLIPE